MMEEKKRALWFIWINEAGPDSSNQMLPLAGSEHKKEEEHLNI